MKSIVGALVTLAMCWLPVHGAQGTQRPIGVVDLHADLSYQVNYKNQQLPTASGQYLASELVKSGVEGVVLPLFIPRDVSTTGPRLADLEASYRAMVSLLAKTQPYALPGCQLPGRVRTWFSFEGSAPLVDPAANLEQWLGRGVTLFGLVHTDDNVLATSAGKGPALREVKSGLTPEGRKLVQRLLQQRALLDVSHASDAAAREIIGLASQAQVPVVASHSNARAVANHARNLNDELITAIARTGGVIGINFHTPFLTQKADVASLDDVVKHVRYIVARVGAQHVAIGSDFEGGIRAARGLNDVRGFPKLALALQASGLPESDVRKIMGLNALRVLCSRGQSPLPQCR